MPVAQDTSPFASSFADVSDVPLAQGVVVSDADYACIMRQITGDDTNTPVSAFNSSI